MSEGNAMTAMSECATCRDVSCPGVQDEDQCPLNVRAEAELQRERADLIERGYHDITKHKSIKVGARVRHVGHQWPEAYRNGTATVLAVMERNPSGWAVQWGRPDIELLAAQDDAERGIGRWADYHVEVIDPRRRRRQFRRGRRGWDHDPRD